MGLLSRSFRKKETRQEEAASPFPLEMLAKHVGETILVEYSEQGLPKTYHAPLKFAPNREFFYMGTAMGYHIVYWDHTAEGKRDYVKLIKDKDGGEIYRGPSA